MSHCFKNKNSAIDSVFRHLLKTWAGRYLPMGVLCLLALNFSCTRQIYNFKWSGTLIDKDTRQPIPYASLFVNAHYQENIDRSDHSDYHLISDAKGRFRHYFNKAYLLEVKIESSGHHPYSHTFKISRKSLPDTILLSKKEQAGNLDISIEEKGFSMDAPFISQRTIYSYKKKKRETAEEVIGYNFLTHERNNKVFDLALMIKTNESDKEIEIVSTGKGGLYPVYEGEVSDSFFLEMERAPSYGFVKTYKLEGNEVGFFIRCRDGKHYAKVIFSPQLYQLNYYTGQDSIIEQGLKFNFILQNDSSNYNTFPTGSLYDELTPADHSVTLPPTLTVSK